MMPALLPGDWLLLDPTCRRWPRPGTIVVIREPGTGILAVKRVAARGRRGTVGRGTVGQGTVAPSVDGPAAVWERPGATAAGPEPSDGGPRSRLGSREAWLLGDAADPLSRFGRLR